MIRGSRRGCVRLKSAALGIGDTDESTFTISESGKMYHFQASNAEEREKWVNALQEVIVRHNQNRYIGELRFRPGAGSLDHQLDRQIQESDLYLQIMMEKLDVMEMNMRIADTEDLREKYYAICETTRSLVDSIKQAILLIQIQKARLTVDSSNDTNHRMVTGDGEGRSLVESSVVDPPPRFTGRSLVESSVVDPPHLPGDDVSYKSFPDVTSAATYETPLSSPHHCLPEHDFIISSSSSSSESGDNFFDASDFQDAPKLIFSRKHNDIIDVDEELNRAATGKVNSNVGCLEQPSSWLESEDDALYESGDNDTESVTVEKHQNVITHLLSQVKIGMDLTKVVLPTFILERRSLLEMYADFFTHPRDFVSITDYKDPRERFMCIVKWYLGSFFSSRKSPVPKKPYNPILGEKFHCSWNTDGSLPEEGIAYEAKEGTMGAGPVPWAKPDQLTFIAEQVSHHPPISAFYVEHPTRRIQAQAYIYTKSKFLGLSVGVHLIGQGCIQLLDYEEEYIMTFPSAYGRSIFTVPWFEMGGKCLISCPQSGFTAEVNFMTKPLMGGKKHQYKPSEEYIDVLALSEVKKQCRPISKQCSNESRRLWRKVTRALKCRNVEAATAAKHTLEERQRSDALKRKDQTTQWKPVHFTQTNNSQYVYNTPLNSRVPVVSFKRLTSPLPEEPSVVTNTNGHQPGTETGFPNPSILPEPETFVKNGSSDDKSKQPV